MTIDSGHRGILLRCSAFVCNGSYGQLWN